MTKIGRNDPCPCGSGKKCKHCCHDKEVRPLNPESSYGQDAEWLKIRRTEGETVHGTLGFAASRYGEDYLEEALLDFSIGGEYPVDEIHLDTIFMAWFAFNWLPKNLEEGRSTRALIEQPLGLQYLKENARWLDDYQKAFIRAACEQPFSFFVITDVVAEKSLGLRDLLLDRTFTVKESQASKVLRRGDIIFGRVVPLHGQAIVVGMAPVAIPPRCHGDLLDLRDALIKRIRKHGFELNQELLLDADLQMRRTYLGMVETLRNPPVAELRNTDGDPLSFVKKYFELSCSPQEALDGLKSLALPEFQDEILEASVHDADGELLEVTFDWVKKGNKSQKHWDNTIMGSLTIKGNVLTAEVNSEKRAKKIQSEITKRLGEKATFKRAVHESAEAKLEEMSSKPEGGLSDEDRREEEEFESRPEIQALLEEQMKAHWENWYTERIPALQNKTPLEAARTKGGRERLEALFFEFERRNEDVRQPYLRVDIEAIRARLGL